MPVLPHLVSRAATAAADTRILDSRQLAQRAAQSLASTARPLLERLSTLTRRSSSNPYCSEGHFIGACYAGLYTGPTPGAVVGIVLGSIAGFLIVLWLLWILSTGGGFIRTSNLAIEEDDVTVRRTHRSRSPRSRRSHRSAYNAEMRETTRRTSPRRDRVIRQERIVRDVPPPRVESSRVRENIIVEESRRDSERRVEGDDIVEVIEEHSSIDGAPPPRRKSRRSSYRS